MQNLPRKTFEQREEIIGLMLKYKGTAESRLEIVKEDTDMFLLEEDEALILEEFYDEYEICMNCGEVFEGMEERDNIICEYCGEKQWL